jgi:hypothetical protein
VVEDEDNGLDDNTAPPSPGRDPGVVRFNGLISCTRCALEILAIDSTLLIELIGRSWYVPTSPSFSRSSPSWKGLEPDFPTVELDPRDFSEAVGLNDEELS